MLIKTKSPRFFKYIKWRVEKQKNFLCTTIGETGGGKTYTDLKAMEILNPDKTPKEIIKNVAFTPIEFLDRLNSGELQKGDCLTWDECGIGLSAKEWQSVSNKLINYVLQTFRHLNLIVFFNTPSFSFIDASSRRLFHSIWITMGINYTTNKCEVKPLLLQTDPKKGKIYFKFLRSDDEKHGLIPVKRIYFSLPSKELRNLYETKKQAFTTKLNKSIYEELQEVEAKRGRKKELTEHQQHILDLLNKGYTTTQISKQYKVTPRAIRGSIASIKKKVGMEAFKPSKPLKTPKI